MDTQYAEAALRIAADADIEHVSAKAAHRIDLANLPPGTPPEALERAKTYLTTRDGLGPLAASRGVSYHVAGGPLPPRV
jgi:hypothetical protein